MNFYWNNNKVADENFLGLNPEWIQCDWSIIFFYLVVDRLSIEGAIGTVGVTVTEPVIFVSQCKVDDRVDVRV